MFRKLLITALLSLLVSVANSNPFQEELETWMNLLNLPNITFPDCDCKHKVPPKLSFSSVEHSTKNVASDILRNFLDNIVAQMGDGIQIDKFGNDTTQLELRNFSLTGLDTMEYTVGSGTPSMFSLTLDLTIENVDINSWYRLDETDLGLLVLYGEGDATISLKDIKFIVDLTARKYSPGLQVTTVNNLVVSVNSSSVHLGGLLNNVEAGQLLNYIINDMIGYILAAVANDISDHLTDGTCFPFLQSSIDVQCITRWVVGTIYCTVFIDQFLPFEVKCIDSLPKPYF